MKKIILITLFLGSISSSALVASSDPYDPTSTRPSLPPTSVDTQLPSPY